jgi:DNA-binding transcriptional ArsR family regulator
MARTCGKKTPIKKRSLLSERQTGGLETLFKVFANKTRLRLLHSLVRDEKLCVTELSKTIGMKPQAVSNQLQRLVDRGILATERNGNNVYYRIIDPCVPQLLDLGMCLLEDSSKAK